MITENDLLNYRHRFMSERHLEKNYLQTMLLFEMYTEFASELVFKGGTALAMFYGLNRFSEDLDFTFAGESSRKETVDRFRRVFTRFNASYKIQNLSDLGRRGTKTSLDYVIKVEGPLYGRTKTAQSITVNLSMREQPLKAPELKYLAPQYPDIQVTGVYVLSEAEILAEKIRAILTRKSLAIRDVYDIYHLTKFRGVVPDAALVEKKLAIYKRRFRPEEVAAKLDGISGMGWKSELSNLLASVPDRHEYIGYLKEGFGNLPVHIPGIQAIIVMAAVPPGAAKGAVFYPSALKIGDETADGRGLRLGKNYVIRDVYPLWHVERDSAVMVTIRLDSVISVWRGPISACSRATRSVDRSFSFTFGGKGYMPKGGMLSFELELANQPANYTQASFVVELGEP